MTPRNSPCPCGSGKKSKRCCGSSVIEKAMRDAEVEQQRARVAESDRMDALDPRRKRDRLLNLAVLFGIAGSGQ